MRRSLDFSSCDENRVLTPTQIPGVAMEDSPKLKLKEPIVDMDSIGEARDLESVHLGKERHQERSRRSRRYSRGLP